MKELANENILVNIMANMVRLPDSSGGRLYLTDRQLFFKAHSLNFDSSSFSLPLAQIARMEKANTLGIIPNGLRVHDVNGKSYYFICWSRSKIIRAFESLPKI